jgi:hypothetical protein
VDRDDDRDTDAPYADLLGNDHYQNARPFKRPIQTERFELARDLPTLSFVTGEHGPTKRKKNRPERATPAWRELPRRHDAWDPHFTICKNPWFERLKLSVSPDASRNRSNLRIPFPAE